MSQISYCMRLSDAEKYFSISNCLREKPAIQYKENLLILVIIVLQSKEASIPNCLVDKFDIAIMPINYFNRKITMIHCFSL